MTNFHSANPDKDELILIDPSASATEQEWEFIKRLISAGREIGFGALDSFLCGPDIDRRVDLVLAEAPKNAALRLQLRDAMSLAQTSDLKPGQIVSQQAAAGKV